MLHPHPGRREGASAHGGGSAADLLENDGMAHAGLRVLASRAPVGNRPGDTAEEVERDLTFFGLAG